MDGLILKIKKEAEFAASKKGKKQLFY